MNDAGGDDLNCRCFSSNLSILFCNDAMICACVLCGGELLDDDADDSDMKFDTAPKFSCFPLPVFLIHLSSKCLPQTCLKSFSFSLKSEGEPAACMP